MTKVDIVQTYFILTGSSRDEQRKKREGMEISASNNAESLTAFRAIARNIHGEVTIDDVRDMADNMGIPYTPGNWLGSVFKDGWEWTGKVVPSTHVGSHGRMVKVWVRK